MARIAVKMGWKRVRHKETGKTFLINPLIYNNPARMAQFGYEKISGEEETPKAPPTGNQITPGMSEEERQAKIEALKQQINENKQGNKSSEKPAQEDAEPVTQAKTEEVPDEEEVVVKDDTSTIGEAESSTGKKSSNEDSEEKPKKRGRPRKTDK